ncbi:DUF1176 domain-containing protein [Sphingomonas sp. AOB5]|uniref:DUF1176 domain-containing protein n=1 Tax=Sphingomonas sp. AOB5 TaxID=3034017 RepID=UPI0023F65F4F|nr:DUF1176 domain-containing protein [Sphingomonas sp. AOB5]MDF7775416.1 DUF1176 domain-containing protein [Sphingomonas sp. AOB5]
MPRHSIRILAGSLVGAALAGAGLMAMLKTLLMTLAIGLFGRDQEWTAPEVREYDDWSVACDNGRRCEAISASAEYSQRLRESDAGDLAMPLLRVVREAGPGKLPRLFVDRRVWADRPAPRKLTLHVYYDGDGDRTGRAYRLIASPSGLDEVDPRDVPAFLAESARSSHAATRLSDGSMHGLITTRGMVAALRFVDEVQGRRDNVTAIYARGSRPASAVYPPKPLPMPAAVRGTGGRRETAAEMSALRSLRDGICGTGVDPRTLTAKLYHLANGHKLWSVDCGVFNGSDALLWLIDPGTGVPEVRNLPRPEQGRPSIVPYLPESSFDHMTGVITARYFDSSRGDCGWERKWAWTGSRFEMIEAREMRACIGILPERWLVTYRTQARRGEGRR